MCDGRNLAPAVDQLVSRERSNAWANLARNSEQHSGEPAPQRLIRRPPPKTPEVAATYSNKERTEAITPVELWHAAAGQSTPGKTAYVEVALLKGSEDGVRMEVASASAQGGVQKEMQVGLARFGADGKQGSAELRTIEAEAHYGTKNADGSEGYNFGASANAIAAEVSVAASGNQLTLGVFAGAGAEGSIGTRDADADGNREYCVRAGAGAVVGGLCIEPAGIAANLADWLTRAKEPSR
jgi:hypothetical protein